MKALGTERRARQAKAFERLAPGTLRGANEVLADIAVRDAEAFRRFAEAAREASAARA